jgi:hypothetical protein
MKKPPAGERERRIELTVGAYRFIGHLEEKLAPVTAAFLAERLPLKAKALHARWSGEAGWAPLKIDRLEPENAIAYPSPGQLLLYAGAVSEPELLMPYGACAFACRAGALAGNHVITLDGDLSDLRPLGEKLLWKGAQPLHLRLL